MSVVIGIRESDDRHTSNTCRQGGANGLKSIQKVRTERRLRCISADAERRPMPQVLHINGHYTSDWQRWLQEAHRFGCSRFGCSSNTLVGQRKRMALAISSVKGQRIDGRSTAALSPFAVVSGRARLKSGTSAGSDDAPPEIYKGLPYVLLISFIQPAATGLKRSTMSAGKPGVFLLIGFPAVSFTKNPLLRAC